MYISEVKIENFRLFGSGEKALVLPLNPGLTALVGGNDAGKTAIIDAIRIVLGTRDQDTLRIDTTDFHQPATGGERAEQIVIKIRFRGLTATDCGAFAEFLTYENFDEKIEATLIVSWVAKRNTKEGSSRRMLLSEWRSGANGEGPPLDFGARSLLTATYLRPLRDAERAMGAGRGSRLSQILQNTKEIKNTGAKFDLQMDPTPDPTTLSVLGLGDYANHLLGQSTGIRQARERLNDEYLKPLSFVNDPMTARIGVNGAQDDGIRLRQLLEKLELALASTDEVESTNGRGLGSNNILFMACELLLLAGESDGFPLLLIEEPEAHLHPQRQLRLMSFLQAQVRKKRTDGQEIQIIVTTHSPNLASDLSLESIVLIEGGHAFPLRQGRTKLSKSDYRFLERFLDVTKANLFFARAVLIVEGDAENILLPVIAKLLERDFHSHGVSIVNVGGVGLGRYARIFMREDPGTDGSINIPVACVTDMDVMPNNAPWIIGKLKNGEVIPQRPQSKRRWRIKEDFPGDGLEQRRIELREKASGQHVETFVADEWTLEFDLSYYGLSWPVWRSAFLALNDERIQSGATTPSEIVLSAKNEFRALSEQNLDTSTLASHIYAKFANEEASKAIAAQYLAEYLEKISKRNGLSSDQLRNALPPYIVAAIAHVTTPFAEPVNDEPEPRR
ncbi:AAA family ATPase [Lysobacter sp. Root559]|uniref:ATP-dependent nuclease n=1 Tax=Lysobacter sp. Root559 TaxID=1736559 RepID=UPI0009EAE3CE|nr:AAA family ATPase [Lysobacter sp. Root559]